MRLGRLLVGIALIEVLAGCYELQLATGAGPQPGALMAMEVNDVGRLALGGQMGPEIFQIEGMLLSTQGDEYEVAVRSVKLIRGGDQVWNSERVRINKAYISQTYERKFSKGRTVAMSAVFVVSAYVVIRKLELFGLGRGEPEIPPCDTCVQAARFPRRP